MNKLILTSTLLFGSVLMMSAEKYAAVLKDTKIFEEPDAQGFTAQNQNGDEITVNAGMVFNILEEKPGWYVVEYSPGIRGYIVQSFTVPVNELQKPTGGDYSLANNKTVIVNVALADGAWTLSREGKNLTGLEKGNVVAFPDSKGVIKYTIVKFGGKTYVYDYSNALTHFF